MDATRPFLAVPVVVTALALAFAPAAFAHGPAPSTHPAGHHEGGLVCDPAVVASFAALDDAMRHAREEVGSLKGSRASRAHLRDDLDVALARLQEARVVACRASQAEIIVVAPRAPGPVVLDERGEAGLVNAMRRASFEDERLAVLSLGVRDVCVTADQAKGLARELTFSRGRVDAVAVLAPRIVDRARAFVILDAMSFDADRRDARDILNATPVAPECRAPPRA